MGRKIYIDVVFRASGDKLKDLETRVRELEERVSKLLEQYEAAGKIETKKTGLRVEVEAENPEVVAQQIKQAVESETVKVNVDAQDAVQEIAQEFEREQKGVIDLTEWLNKVFSEEATGGAAQTTKGVFADLADNLRILRQALRGFPSAKGYPTEQLGRDVMAAYNAYRNIRREIVAAKQQTFGLLDYTNRLAKEARVYLRYVQGVKSAFTAAQAGAIRQLGEQAARLSEGPSSSAVANLTDVIAQQLANLPAGQGKMAVPIEAFGRAVEAAESALLKLNEDFAAGKLSAEQYERSLDKLVDSLIQLASYGEKLSQKVLTKDQAIYQAANLVEEMQRAVRDELAERRRNIFNWWIASWNLQSSVGMLTKVGDMLTRPFDNALKAYLAVGDQANRVAIQWASANKQIVESQQEVGAVVASITAGIAEQKAKLTQLVAELSKTAGGRQAIAATYYTGKLLQTAGRAGQAVAQVVRMVIDVRAVQLAILELQAAQLQQRASSTNLIAAMNNLRAAQMMLAATAEGVSIRGLEDVAKTASSANLSWWGALRSFFTGRAEGSALQTSGAAKLASLGTAALSVAKTLGAVSLAAGGFIAVFSSMRAAMNGFIQDLTGIHTYTASLGEAAVAAAYGLGNLVQKAGEFAEKLGISPKDQSGLTFNRPTNQGREWGEAVYKLLYGNNELSAQTQTETQAVAAFEQFQQQLRQIQEQYDQQRITVTEEYERRRAEAVRQYEEQIAQATEEFLRARERAYQDFYTNEARQLEDYNIRRRRAIRDAYDRYNSLWDAYYKKRIEYINNHHRDLAELEREHQKRLRRLLEDHKDRMEDIIAQRDAAAAYREMRDFEKRRRREEEDYQDRLRKLNEYLSRYLYEMEKNFKAQREAVLENLKKQLADMEEDFRRQAARRQEDFDKRLRREQEDFDRRMELMEQAHERELQQLEEAKARELRQLLKSYNDQREAAEQAFADRLRQLNYWLGRENEAILSHHRRLYQQMVEYFARYGRQLFYRAYRGLPYPNVRNANPPSARSTPTSPSVGGAAGGTVAALATGGYAETMGQYLLGEGGREFVLSAGTTQLLEQHFGGRITESKIIRSLRAPVNLTINVAAGADPEAIAGIVMDQLNVTFAQIAEELL